MLEKALPNRAPPPPGWGGDDVGGVPWHLRDAYNTPVALAARVKAEAEMRRIISGTKEAKAAAMLQAEAAANGQRIVTAAVGRAVVCRSSATQEAVCAPCGSNPARAHPHRFMFRDDMFSAGPFVRAGV